jgi:phenylalanyl-tRNA synthetase beta chain
LKICKIDIGSKILNIVCGAPNVKEKYIIPVAKIGAIINEIKIKEIKIRGIISEGMICSGKELGLNDDHTGILILSERLKIGQNLNNALDLVEDSIFDFDITPNRGDCFSHLGIARELGIIENKRINCEEPTLKLSNFKTKAKF